MHGQVLRPEVRRGRIWLHLFKDACKCMVRCFALRSGAGESGCTFARHGSARGSCRPCSTRIREQQPRQRQVLRRKQQQQHWRIQRQRSGARQSRRQRQRQWQVRHQLQHRKMLKVINSSRLWSLGGYLSHWSHNGCTSPTQARSTAIPGLGRLRSLRTRLGRLVTTFHQATTNHPSGSQEPQDSRST